MLIVKRFLFAIFLCIPLFSSSLARALDINELIIERSNDYLVGTILVNNIARKERDLRVSLLSAEEYEKFGLRYTNFIRDLSISYERINRHRGNIKIDFPYEPVDAFDLLLELNWGAGAVQRRYSVRLNGVLPEGNTLARISPAPVRSSGGLDSGGSNIFHANRIQTVEGDSWQNLALAIRQAYLRDTGISQEQVMLALREKNPDSFVGGRRLRIGIALDLPNYYEVSSIDSREAQDRIFALFRSSRQSRPRLEIAAARPESVAESVRVLNQAEPVKLADPGEGADSKSEELDKDRRELVDKQEDISLVRKQLQQIDKLLELKTARIFALQSEAASQEDIEVSAVLDREQDVLDVKTLLNQRWEVIKSEFGARPVFWLSMAIGFFLFFTLLIFISARLRRSRRSMTMRDLYRSDDGSGRNLAATRSLIFEDEDNFSVPSRGLDPISNFPPTSSDDSSNANLDLARAYINMGEKKRAQAMLNEVLNEGTPAEKDRARQLLIDIK